MYKCLCHSVQCSMMLRRVKIWSVHPRPFRKPVFSYLIRWSTASEIRLMMTLARILVGTDKRVTLLQLFQLLRALFFGFLPMTPSSSGNCFSSLMLQRVAANSALKGYALRLFCPGPLTLFRELMGAMISSFSGAAILYFCLDCWWWFVQNFAEMLYPSCPLLCFRG